VLITFAINKKKIKTILFSFLFFFILLFFLSGCSSLSYSWHIFSGHLEVLSKSEPIKKIISDPHTSERLKNRLLLAEEARLFAINKLKLPDNSSYTRYSDIKRSSVVWNVVVASEFSLELKSWCFPVTGCVSYRGFYNEQYAQEYAKSVETSENIEVAVVNVPAYSTLGWSNLLGGDPILNTFVFEPDTHLVGLIFHELAHQKIYIKNDSSFNEAFATAVERIGVNQWLELTKPSTEISYYKSELVRKKEFNFLLKQANLELKNLYSKKINLSEMKIRKIKIMENLRKRLFAFVNEDKLDVGQKKKYLSWVNSLNNAYLGLFGVYEDLTPGFIAVFNAKQKSWGDFYREVKEISKKPKHERNETLLNFQNNYHKEG
tara:strand:- start:340 stop:1467 length:1128 start_codon:yes stop_codon:yes gene_type:complete